MKTEYKHSDITEKIIGAAYAVYNTLSHGFLEKVYENALALELRAEGMAVVQQGVVDVLYHGSTVGRYFADMIVADQVIVEVKAISELDKAHEVQLVNYLKASEMEVGLLINFGRKIEIRRRIFDRPGPE